MGDEAGYGFSLNYDKNVLSNPFVQRGKAGGDVLTNTTVPGIIGVSVDFGGATIRGGKGQQLIIVTFDVHPKVESGRTALRFTNDLAVKTVSNTSAQLLATRYVDGIVNIINAKKANVSGQVFAPNGKGISKAKVVLTKADGTTIKTKTNSFGYYNFNEVATGEGYTIEVEHKRYNFESQELTLKRDVKGLVNRAS